MQQKEREVTSAYGGLQDRESGVQRGARHEPGGGYLFPPTTPECFLLCLYLLPIHSSHPHPPPLLEHTAFPGSCCTPSAPILLSHTLSAHRSQKVQPAPLLFVTSHNPGIVTRTDPPEHTAPLPYHPMCKPSITQSGSPPSPSTFAPPLPPQS